MSSFDVYCYILISHQIFSKLCQWLWPKLLREQLALFIEFRNGVRMRKDKNKAGPSGMSRNNAFSLPESWGGRNCLLSLNDDQLKVVDELREALGGPSLLDFVPADFSAICADAYDRLGIEELSFENIWSIFREMLPLVYP